MPVAEAQALLSGLDTRWHLAEDGRALTRQITFRTFSRAMAFLNRLAEIAERGLRVCALDLGTETCHSVSERMSLSQLVLL